MYLYLLLLFTAFVLAMVMGAYLFLGDEHHEETAALFIVGAILALLILKTAFPYFAASPFWVIWPILVGVVVFACGLFACMSVKRSLECGRLRRT